MTLDEQSRPALAALLDHGPTWPPPGAAGGPQRNHCRFAHEGMLAVAWDGRVAPCLSLLHTHPEYVNGHWKTVHSHAVGHVDERPLLDIWRDVTYRDFRQRLRVFDFAALFRLWRLPGDGYERHGLLRQPVSRVQRMLVGAGDRVVPLILYGRIVK